jgi:hypothetical protein
MRSSITIFVIGVVLGSTLGIGGLWTQVVQPAYQEIEQLNEEQGVMQQALDEAGETLQEVATSLRSDAAPADATKPTEVAPSSGGGGAVAPTQPTETKTALPVRERKRLAERLDGLAGKLDRARARK